MSFNFPYLLFFIPLIGSFINQLFSSKKFHLLSTIFVLASVSLIALMIIPMILINGDLVLKITDKPLFLLGEYKIGFINIFFVTIIFITKLAELFRYNRNLLGLHGLANKRFFYSVYLINCFAIVGILLSNNIFNLFIFLEIYSFTFYSIISNYKDYKLSVIAFKYFLTGVFGSVLILLSILGLYLTLKTADIHQIFALIQNLSVNNYLLLIILFLMFLAGIFNKFFTFWIYFSKVEKANTTSNHLFISLIFTHIFLGVYLLLKLIYFIFGSKLYTNFYFEYIFILFGIGLISYYSYQLLKRKNLFYIALKLALIDLGYIFLNLGLNNISSLSSVFLILINHFLVNSLIFFIASFLIYNYKSADISFLKVFQKYRYAIMAIFVMKLFFPFTVNFMSDKNFILATLESKQYYLLLPLAFNKIVLMNLIGKMHSSFAIGMLREKMVYNKNSVINRNYTISFFILFGLIAFSNSPFIQDFANTLSTQLFK